VNKGRSYTPQIPGVGLAGDWPGAWTQSYSQLDTMAGAAGFDANYFVTQVAGLTQIAGSLMAQDNVKIILDLGWGQIASGLTCALRSICTTTPLTGLLPDSQFNNPALASVLRNKLMFVYNAAMTAVQNGQYPQARNLLQTLQLSINSTIKDPNQTALDILISNQMAKLP
jgi:hypothetical protein